MVGNGVSVLPQLSLGKSSITISRNIVGVQAQGVAIVGNGISIPP